jgi:hypothetical protein
MTQVPTVLFVCEHNAGRSQLAAGLAAHRADGTVNVLLAGTAPDDQVSDAMLASLQNQGDCVSRSPRRRLITILLSAALGWACLLSLPPTPTAALRPWRRTSFAEVRHRTGSAT